MLTAELQELKHERTQLISEIAKSKQTLELLLASLGADTSDLDDSKLRALDTSAPGPTNGDTSALVARLILVEGRIGEDAFDCLGSWGWKGNQMD